MAQFCGPCARGIDYLCPKCTHRLHKRAKYSISTSPQLLDKEGQHSTRQQAGAVALWHSLQGTRYGRHLQAGMWLPQLRLSPGALGQDPVPHRHSLSLLPLGFHKVSPSSHECAGSLYFPGLPMACFTAPILQSSHLFAQDNVKASLTRKTQV